MTSAMLHTTRLDDWSQIIRVEFQALPHLRLDVTQAARRWELDVRDTELILESLVDCGLLRRSLDGSYCRPRMYPENRAFARWLVRAERPAMRGH